MDEAHPFSDYRLTTDQFQRLSDEIDHDNKFSPEQVLIAKELLAICRANGYVENFEEVISKFDVGIRVVQRVIDTLMFRGHFAVVRGDNGRPQYMPRPERPPPEQPPPAPPRRHKAGTKNRTTYKEHPRTRAIYRHMDGPDTGEFLTNDDFWLFEKDPEILWVRANRQALVDRCRDVHSRDINDRINRDEYFFLCGIEHRDIKQSEARRLLAIAKKLGVVVGGLNRD